MSASDRFSRGAPGDQAPSFERDSVLTPVAADRPLALFADLAESLDEFPVAPSAPLVEADQQGGLARWQEHRARRMLAAHLDGGVSLAEVARACELSPGHFARAFGRSTGLPPHRWLAEQRVSEAQRLLRGTVMPLAEVARAAGFASQSHFTTAFARHTGVTPGVWRRTPPPAAPAPSPRGSYGSRIGDNFRTVRPPTLVSASDDGAFALTRVSLHRANPERTEPLPEEDAFIVGLQLRDLTSIELWTGSRLASTAPMMADTVSMVHLSERPSSRTGPLDTLHFYMQCSALDSIAEEHGVGRIEALRYRPGVSVPDARLQALGRTLVPAFAHPDLFSDLLVDQLSLAVRTHVILTYGVLQRAPRAVRGGLAPWQLGRAQEMLAAHLDGAVSIEQLARECGLTRSHFTRAFARSTGLSPHRWLSRRRVEVARSLLVDPRVPLAVVGAASGFSSQSHFSRVFTATTGLTPGAWRRAHAHAPRRDLPMLTPLNLDEFLLHPSHQDGEFRILRGQRLYDGLPCFVAVPLSDTPAPQTLERFARSYALRHELDPSWAVRPIALGTVDSHTYLVMEEPRGTTPLAVLVGRPFALGDFLRIGAGVAAALEQFHARGFIHRDIKPVFLAVDTTTGQTRIAGFGLATRVPRHRQGPEPLAVIAGTLAYMAPEQTGRMNRSVDSRSDLYALGVTLYEMLTGEVPFTSADPMELVHCHLARRPVPPDQRRDDLPAVVSDIVMRLLAKAAEDRYQTAAGVEADLRACLAQLEATGRVAPFALGGSDESRTLRLPERLYGREREVASLLEVFDGVGLKGPPPLVLVSGYSGVGKSSVVNELHKALVPPRGLFAAGKFDQLKRDVPYATLAEAFQRVMRSLLAQPADELAGWRRRLGEALEAHGRLLTELMPDLERIVGPQPPAPELAPAEAQNVFRDLFVRFIRVFAQPEHPLALFLDDLQWLDPATLDLLSQLALDAELGSLLLIGAYRDNEVGPEHPLTRWLESLRVRRGRLHELTLSPLAFEHVHELVTDTTGATPAATRPLARMVYEKTGGNPFFAIQFIEALHAEGLLTREPGRRGWTWDLGRIQDKGFTDNVADLMVGKIARLEPATREVLAMLACLGNRVPSETLARVLGLPVDEIERRLDQALVQGFVARSEDAYVFQHDRIQEAAYGLVAPADRAAAHARCGAVLLASTPPARLAESAFAIVGQLNRSIELLPSPDERLRLAGLNLVAARRARAATAYASTLSYASIAESLLPDDRWAEHYGLAFEIARLRAESEMLTGRHGDADRRLLDLAGRARPGRDLGAVTCLRIAVYTALNDHGGAVRAGLEHLAREGVEWPEHPGMDLVGAEVAQIKGRLGDRAVASLAELPAMTDPGTLATMEVLVEMSAAALWEDPLLYALVVAREVNLSLAHGNCDASSFAYTLLGMLFGPILGDYGAAEAFGRLGYALVERDQIERYRSRVYLLHGYHIGTWTRGLRATAEMIDRGIQAALRTGDVVYATYGLVHAGSSAIGRGEELAVIERQAVKSLEYARTRLPVCADTFIAQMAVARELRGLPLDFAPHASEAAFEDHLALRPGLSTGAREYLMGRLQTGVVLEDWERAGRYVEHARLSMSNSQSFFERADFHFYTALLEAERGARSPGRREAAIAAVREHLAPLATWARLAPDTFAPRERLLEAELARLEGRPDEAHRLHEEAIRLARQHGLVNVEGLALVRAARFALARELPLAAQAYLRAARHAYARWGAMARVQRLDAEFPELRAGASAPTATDTIGAAAEHLDLATVLRVSQALAREIVLDDLVRSIMVVALQNAGAERGALLMPSGEALRVEAEAVTGLDDIVLSRQQRPAHRDALPLSVLQYVSRTHTSVLLNDAASASAFATDAYLRRGGERSVLALPLVNQGKLVAILYLENNLSSHVFTPSRVAVLTLVASQAAVALENALLYAALQKTQARMGHAERVGQAASFSWNLVSGEMGWSDRAFEIFGYEPALTPSLQAMRDRIHPDDLDVFDHTFAAPDRSECELRLALPDGRLRYVQVARGELRDEAGRVVEHVGAVRDVTARKLADEALERTQRSLAHVARVTTLGELTASITHEVRQPLAASLTNINAVTRWLDRPSPDLAEAIEAARRAAASCKRANEVVLQLRSLYKNAAPQRETLDLNEAASEVLALVKSELLRHKAVVHRDLAAGLPAIRADRVQLQQVLLNLILNAAEAMGEVDHAREITVRTAAEGDGVRVSVQDRGPGVDPAAADRIFESFHTTKATGMGMGLSICRTIVESHQGRLWLEASQAPGATFTFVLPGGHAAPDEPARA